MSFVLAHSFYRRLGFPRGILTVVEKQIAVFGLGYVGSVTAACLASLGHRVIGVDKDEFKIRSVNEGRSPFFEPGLDELIANQLQAGRLRATTSAAAALDGTAIAIICVGTPSERNGNLGLQQLQRVVSEIASVVEHRSEQLIVAIRSTVFPGTCEEAAIPVLNNNPAISVVANPEFLREGTAVRDFMKPSLIVVGGHDEAAAAQLASIYAPLGVEPCIVSLRTAEMIKYACNAFHALKIGFANEIGALASQVGAVPDEVMQTLCRDVTLNLSPAYLKPGFAFGGSCLPKDLRALVYRASRLDLKLPLVCSIVTSNDAHLERALEQVLELPAKRIGVFGLAFKENTDDLRESPVVRLLEQLIGKGRNLRIFDPHIRLGEIYGSNQRYLLAAIPHIGNLMVSGMDELLEWADHVVVTQKPAPAYEETLRCCGLPRLDLYRILVTTPPPAQAAAPSA